MKKYLYKNIINVFLIQLVFTLLLICIVSYFDSKYGIIYEEKSKSIYLNLLVGLIIGPVIEEYLFRYPLQSKNYKYIIPFTTFFSLYPYYSKNNLYIFLIIYLIILIAMFYLNNQFYNKAYLIIALSVLFAAAHAEKEIVYTWKAIFIPLMILSQFIMGIILSYLRIKYNMRFVIIYHFFWNLIILTISAVTNLYI